MSPKTLAPRAIGLQGGDGATAPSWTRIQIRCPIAALDKSGKSGQARFHAPLFKRSACFEHSNFFKVNEPAPRDALSKRFLAKTGRKDGRNTGPVSPKTLAPRAIGLQGGDEATALGWDRIQILCPIAALDRSGESGWARFHAPLFRRGAGFEHSNFFKVNEPAPRDAQRRAPSDFWPRRVGKMVATQVR